MKENKLLIILAIIAIPLMSASQAIETTYRSYISQSANTNILVDSENPAIGKKENETNDKKKNESNDKKENTLTDSSQSQGGLESNNTVNNSNSDSSGGTISDVIDGVTDVTSGNLDDLREFLEEMNKPLEDMLDDPPEFTEDHLEDLDDYKEALCLKNPRTCEEDSKIVDEELKIEIDEEDEKEEFEDITNKNDDGTIKADGAGVDKTGSASENNIRDTGISIIDLKTSSSSNTYTSTVYKDSNLYVTIAGKKQGAFCIDPSLKVPKGNIECKKLEAGEGISLLYEYLGEEKLANMTPEEHTEVQLVFRMMSALESFTMTEKNDTNVKNAIDYYVKIKSGDQEAIERGREILTNMGECDNGGCSTPDQLAEKFMKDQGGIVNNAFQLAQRLTQAGGSSGLQNSMSQMGAGTLEFQKGSVVGDKVFVHVNATAPIEEVTFKSPDSTIISQQWNGSTGMILLQLAEDSCAYTIEAYYENDGPYECTNSSPETQTLIAFLHADSQTAAQVVQSSVSAIECDKKECCTEAPEIEPGYIEGEVNNCCDDTHSEAKEYELDDLFCYDEELKVEHFWKKCSIDYYLEDKADLNDYCEMYCTERVTVDIPGPLTAISGRYFTLEKNPVGNTTSSYIEGYKRCRIRIQYDIWEADYYEQVTIQKDTYNTIQKLRAREKMYKKSVETPTEPRSGIITATASGSCQYDTGATDEDGDPIYATESCSATSSPVSYSYEAYKFPLTQQDYYTILVNQEERNIPAEVFDAIHFDPDGNPIEKHTPYSVDGWGALVAAAESTRPDAESKCAAQCTKCSCSPSSSRNRMPHEAYAVTDENTPDVLSQIQGDIAANIQKINDATCKAMDLEKDIDDCNEYWTKGKGTDADAHYEFEATQEFSYSQVYLDEMGTLVQDRIYVEFEEEPGCEISGPIIGGDGLELADPRYSGVYKEGVEEMTDFDKAKMTDGNLQLHESPTEYEGLLHKMYPAKKVFTHDAKYKAVCEWNEGKNQLFTLVPNGYSTENTTTINKTIHEQEYRIHLTTLEGTYITYWDIAGLGEDGKFDQYFLEAGQTCSNEDPEDVAMLTCKLKVEYEVVLTGYCNGTNGGSANNDPDDCDPNTEMYQLFTFKIVDPSNLFPTDPMENGEALYGYNWLVDERGQEVLGTIQERGKEDMTYARDNLTYAFDLTPTDMRHIKNYNESREFAGGYSDFTLNCECPQEVNPTDGCVRCKSTFLAELANGRVTYGRTGHDVSGWSNNKETLGQIRNKNNW